MPDEAGEYNLPDDFDLDAGFDTGQGENPNSLAGIATEFGWDDWRDIVADNTDLEADNIRPGIYAYAEDAIFDAYDRGILDFSEIYWDGEYWHIIVSYDGA